ncbi:aminotransferase [Micromonospora pisi]|uniref:Aminotransferase n=1 Tax=Micromonospora pisi TaxID=589240 RepID=A0A495JD93_9ACTN|nr:DegT/DnrJ/EryC1/StrS family aminotransferase [Micromonospora pisi]RKR86885.1 aminotransferase [Micromonospora pisi]
MSDVINVFQPSLGEEELAAIAEVFASGWVGYGSRAEDFQAQFAAHIGVPAENMIFINSATSGLFLAVELLGLGPGDEVVLPSQGFVANANSVLAAGARPVFCDVDPHTLNPGVADVERVLSPRTKAVMVLHYGGYPGEIAEIAALCRQRGLPLIEDAACAPASAVDGQRCGSFGDMAVWSFDSRKIITTGDGGMLFVRDPSVARRANRLAYHGLEDRSSFTTAARVASRWWDLHVEETGRRLIGNDMTAAIGSVQLRRLPEFVRRRREIAETYDGLLRDVEGIRLPPPIPTGHATSYYFYWVQMPAEVRDQVAENLLGRGIYTTFRYAPLHHVPIFRGVGELPGTDEATRTTLLLPLHQRLSDAEVHRVAKEVRRAVEGRLGALPRT